MKRRAQVFCLGLLVFTTLFAGCSKKGAPAVAETADRAVLQITEGLADGRAEMLWHFLPESYQQDVTGLVHEFGAKMDAELWNESFGVVQKLTRVLDEKRDFILDHPMLASQMKDRDEAEEVWDGVVGVLEVLVDSDLADLDKLKKLDVERFLAKTGGDLIGGFKTLEALAPTRPASGSSLFGLSDAEAELISSEGDKARVRVTIPGQPPSEDDYVRVEGKWIPADMAAEWDQTVAEIRRGLDKFSGEDMKKNKQTTLMQLAMVDSALDQLLATKTAEDFQLAIGGLMGMAMGAVMAQAQDSGGFNPFAGGSTPSFDSQPLPSTTMHGYDVVPMPSESNKGAGARVYRREGIEDYIGEEVRITERDGSRMNGYVVSVSDRMLVLEKRFRGGSMTVELNPARIESFEPI